MKTFVDTNVFVYASDLTEPTKHERASAWLERLWRDRSGRTSIQVLSEFFVTTTQKLKPGLGRDDARSRVSALFAWAPAVVDRRVIEQAWVLQDRYAISFWDAQIVAAAKQQACAVLLTEDLQDGQDLDGVVVVDPFRTAP